MFRNILVPVDLSERNDAALRAATRLADDGATIRLLHVIETIRDVPFDELRDFYEDLEKHAEQAIDRCAARLADADVEIEREISFGPRSREIVHVRDPARDARVDRIMEWPHRLPGSILAAPNGASSSRAGRR